MPDSATPSPNRRRETLLLILVAVLGIGGILALQLSRKDPVTSQADRGMVQSANNNANRESGAGEAIQRVPGNLIRENEQPEAGRPFLFEMANFSQGAVYELDLGDGARKAFSDQGTLRHTYAKPGPYTVTLYALFEGEEVKLQSVQKVVAQTVQVNKKITPVIDF
jgi:hypothetical protein